MLAFTCAFMLVGCGDDGSDGAPGSDADASAMIAELQAQLDAGLITIAEYEAAIAALQTQVNSTKISQTESCATCHNGDVQFDGAAHQSAYDKYTDTTTLGLTITGVTFTPNADPTKTDVALTFTATENGNAVTLAPATFATTFPQKTFYVVGYNGTQFVNSLSVSVNSTGSNLVNNGGGSYTSTVTASSVVTGATYSLAYGYLAKDLLTDLGDSSQTMYDNMVSASYTGADLTGTSAAAYVSTANVEACENCHGAPYRKHGYREAAVAGLPDFVACKTCHYDTRNGGHAAWQLLYDDPAAYAAQDGVTTTDQNTKYAYKASVMNDVHMSHNMEFAYPQSMANCVTCHEGKLDRILDNDNFVVATCQSCHAIDNLNEKAKAKYASHPTLTAASAACNTSCHQDGTGVEFDTIHTGYNSAIYKSTSTTDLNALVKYADAISISFGTITYNSTAKTLTFEFTLTDSSNVADMQTVVPTVIISGYGYNTKNFLVSGHSSNNGSRVGEGALSTTTAPANFSAISNPTKTAASTSWKATYNLSALDYTGLITSGAISKVEIGVMPKVVDADGNTVAASADSTTFNLSTNAVVANYYQGTSEVIPAASCNKCHEQLATTFHSPAYGGKITVCRMCHSPASGGSHLEMQSRSIDSYVHAIHSFQAFDTKNIDWTDDVEALEYEHHIESTYPNFTIMNCESCHNPGTYDVPDQSKSLPGVLSASYTWTKDRNIGTVASAVTGPASRACGSCHRSHYINEDEAGDLANLNAHVTSFGYYVTSATGVFDSVVSQVMALFQ